MFTCGQLFTTFTNIFHIPAGLRPRPVLVQLGENNTLWQASYTAGEVA